MSIKKNYLASILLCLMIVFSQLTIGFSSSASVSGTAKIFVIEFFIFILAVYVVAYQLLIKKKIRQTSQINQYLFSFLIIFTIFYLIGLVYRLVSGQSLAGNFLLARIIMEMICLVLIVDYFAIPLKSILLGLIGARTIGTLIQYYTLFFGKGGIRGPGNMLDNSVTEYAYLLLLFPILIYSAIFFKGILRNLSLFNIIANIPTLILSGSRVAFPLMVFLLVISLIYCYVRIDKKKSVMLLGTAFLISIISLAVIGIFSSNDNRQALSRSISVPVSLFNKVASSKLNIDINKFSTPAYVSEKATKKRNVEETIELSNDMRYEINSRTKKIIMASPTNFLFGVGASSVPALNGNQKPHNLFLLFMLPFGLIGTIICFLIIFAPILFALKNKINLNSLFLIVMTYLPVVVISMNQPIFGTMVICFAIFLLTYSIYKFRDELAL